MLFETYLFPDTYENSIYEIDMQKLYHDGYRTILFDIDNTLTPHGAPADENLIQFFKNLKQTGLTTCLISNNRKERVSSFSKSIDVPFIYQANKPSVRGIMRACQLLSVEKSACVLVGDQIFTDIIAGKRAGIYTILVSPIDKKEEMQIVLKRYFEKIVLFFYERKRKNHV